MEQLIYLPMKKKWFDMILVGEKKEEYREFKPHWMTRVKKWNDSRVLHNVHTRPCEGIEFSVELGSIRPNQICFVNGYKKSAPRFVAWCTKYEVRTKIEHPEWGEGEYDGKPHFVFHIGHIVKETITNAN